MVDLRADRALFAISVAAEVTGVNPPMLRIYEQKGLLEPYRTRGGTRRYSGQELDRIGEITTLLAAGLNLAGVEHVLRLRAENHRLQQEVERLRDRGRKSAKDPTAGPTSVGTVKALVESET
jgi:MerR family transcriptional regulator, heat shock protein HspR